MYKVSKNTIDRSDADTPDTLYFNDLEPGDVLATEEYVAYGKRMAKLDFKLAGSGLQISENQVTDASLYLPPKILTLYDRIPDEIKDMRTEDLISKLRPSFYLYEERDRFWIRVLACLKDNTKIPMNFFGKYYDNTKKFKVKQEYSDTLSFAFILHPKPTMQNYLNGMMEVAKDRLAEILYMPISDDKGSVSINKANLVFNVAKYFIDRVHGEPARKIAIATMNMNQPEAHREFDSIEDKIKVLEDKLQGTLLEYRENTANERQ